MDISVKRSSLGGSLSVPGSKSHTIRAVLLATMAEGASTIRNPLTSLDGMSALNAARTFGAEVVEEPGKWTVRGLAGKLHAPANYLDCGNSGSVAYFATPMAATIDDYTFVTVHGGAAMHGAVTESHDDHRVAMALSVAGLAIDGETVIKDAECATVSFPGFFDVMRGVGADFTSK